MSKLYKKNVNGSTQVWWAEVRGGEYRMHSGQFNGKITTSAWTVAEPKNVGRANATTAAEQAKLEVAAAYELKKKRGYRENVDEAQGLARFTPMLAHPYDKYADRVTAAFEASRAVAVQPKLDGIRCIATAQGLFSRAGNPLLAVPHIHEALTETFKMHPQLVLDGELYNHDYREDFPALVSLIKKQKPTAEDLKASRAGVQYWVYDCALPHAATTTRQEYLQRVLPNGDCLRKVDTSYVLTQAGLENAHAEHLARGFEGSMIRMVDANYEQKRVATLLKYKQWKDAEFEVLGIEAGVGNGAGYAKTAILRMPNGKEGSASVMGPREYCQSVLKRRASLIGGEATVEFFDYTPEGKLRFGRVKVFHGGNRAL
jgi:ATP-dependent DNA ligase